MHIPHLTRIRNRQARLMFFTALSSVRDQGRWNQLELYRIKLEIKSEKMVKNSFIGSLHWSIALEAFPVTVSGVHAGGFVTC